MDHFRSNNRLFVMSISNNPGEDSFETNSFPQNMVGTDFANNDWFLFGLGLNADLSPVAGNGVPGALADRTLSVAAWGVNAIDKDGNVVPVSGNSFAAPTIAGAAALLTTYCLQLGCKELQHILLRSHTDHGVPGGVPVHAF